MTRRSSIRLLSFSIIFVVILGVWGLIGHNQAKTYKIALEASYQQNLNQLNESLYSIEGDLTKSMYSNSSDKLLDISEDLYSETNTAIESISTLPVAQLRLEGTYKYLSQLSDYSKYLAEKLSDGKKISNEEFKNITSLLDYCKELQTSVTDMVSLCNKGGEITSKEVKSSDSKENSSVLSNTFTASEDIFEDYPTLVYDGPFADSVLHKKPQFLKDKKVITVDKARSLASYYLNLDENNLTFESEETNDIENYVFKSDKYTIGITKRGGMIDYVLNSSVAKKATISNEEAIKIANDYLEFFGYRDMKRNYYAVNDNIILINYAYSSNNVLYYADSIKVGINLATGKITEFEASAYLTNHTTRNLNKKAIKLADAQKKISTYLNILGSKEAVIPKDNGKEEYCYEFHCESKTTGDEVLIYINTETGDEEDILLLLYADNGTFTK